MNLVRELTAVGSDIPTDARKDPAGFLTALGRLYKNRHGVVVPPVKVVFSGREAGSTLGYYSRKLRQIVINEVGMSDYCLRATLTHEYAHHVQYTCALTEGNTTYLEPGTSHGTVFQIQHARLRELAVNAGLLPSLEQFDETLCEAIRHIQSLRRTGGEAILQTGQELAKARARCWEIGEGFEVFLRDYVAFDRTTAYDYIRAFEMGIPPTLCFTTMRLLMRIKNVATREKATADAVQGVPLVVLRARYAVCCSDLRDAGDEMSALLKEKAKLLHRLREIESRLKLLQPDGERLVAFQPRRNAM